MYGSPAFTVTCALFLLGIMCIITLLVGGLRSKDPKQRETDVTVAVTLAIIIVGGWLIYWLIYWLIPNATTPGWKIELYLGTWGVLGVILPACRRLNRPLTPLLAITYVFFLPMAPLSRYYPELAWWVPAIHIAILVTVGVIILDTWEKEELRDQAARDP